MGQKHLQNIQLRVQKTHMSTWFHRWKRSLSINIISGKKIRLVQDQLPAVYKSLFDFEIKLVDQIKNVQKAKCGLMGL